MYCWIHQPFFVAIAQASSVTEARKLVLAQCGHGDGSCIEREKAATFIENNTPAIWHGPNAEFTLTDNAELIELSAYLDKTQADLKNTSRDYSELRESYDKLFEEHRDLMDACAPPKPSVAPDAEQVRLKEEAGKLHD